MFDDSLKSEISQWSFEKINYVDFLEIENFLSNFSKQNLNIGFGMPKKNLIFVVKKVYFFKKIYREWNYDNQSKELVKIILSQLGERKFISTI
jgi:endonuclease IV